MIQLLVNLLLSYSQKVGTDGVITVEESKGIETYMDIVEGMKFDRGYQSNILLLMRKNEL